MSDNKRPQLFRATYSVSGPASERTKPKTRKTFYWSLPATPDRKHYLTSEGPGFSPNAVEDMKLLGGLIQENVYQDGYGEEGPNLATRLKIPLGEVEGAIFTSGYSTWCTIYVETPTALGAGEHQRRCAQIEDYLDGSDHGIVGVKWTKECQTIHSEDACRPVGRRALGGVPNA